VGLALTAESATYDVYEWDGSALVNTPTLLPGEGYWRFRP